MSRYYATLKSVPSFFGMVSFVAVDYLSWRLDPVVLEAGVLWLGVLLLVGSWLSSLSAHVP